MKIAISGGTGLIGSHLLRHFREQGHEMLVISRSPLPAGYDGVVGVKWNELREGHADKLEGLDALIHLAGESINQRWTKAAKQRIIESRVESTRLVVQVVGRLEHKPRVVISGSAIGIYGTSESATLDERSPVRVEDFLSSVVKKWEEAAAQMDGVRLVHLRTGLVLARDGGALPKMLLPYRLGVGGRIGEGKQWLSWIHIDDLVRLVELCMENELFDGPVNATSPNPVTNDQFGRAAARSLRRPHWLPAPAFAFRLLFGEMADLLLQGQRVLPEKASRHGFDFSYPNVTSALEDLIRSR